MAELETVDHIVETIGHILDLVPDAFDLYLVGLQLAPDKLRGFMGFVTNPKAVPLGISSGVPQPANLLVVIDRTPATPSVLLGSTINFAASAPGAVPPVTYHWDFGDGFASSSSAPSHLYARGGTYVVNLVITDGQGNVGSASSPVSLVVLAP